jgi:adenylosuccinate lyase
MSHQISIMAISPIDGRYTAKTASLAEYMSEFGLIKYRVMVEIEWLIFLCNCDAIAEVPQLATDKQQFLRDIYLHFSEKSALAVKEHEKTTNHDVKAVEYFIADKLRTASLEAYVSWIHFACTSEDINNVAYALMLRDATDKVMLPNISHIAEKLKIDAITYAAVAMQARTHGQSATHTTMGKEFANVYKRLERQITQLQQQNISAKFNGAVGNYNAHMSAYPNLNWADLNSKFITSLGLEFNAYTTQIEPHDTVAELLQNIIRINNIILDLCRDMWSYISIAYFKQQMVDGEVGSSTMPHKVNPIDFENAEGNIGLCNALADHLANKLPISRWQRDLSDSTVLRNLGSVFAYALIAYQACLKGLNKCIVNEEVIKREIENAWELLAEPVQTILRKANVPNAYEQLKDLSRGQKLNKEILDRFIDALDIEDNIKNELKGLRPDTYLGAAVTLAKI